MVGHLSGFFGGEAFSSLVGVETVRQYLDLAFPGRNDELETPILVGERLLFGGVGAVDAGPLNPRPAPARDESASKQTPSRRGRSWLFTMRFQREVIEVLDLDRRWRSVHFAGREAELANGLQSGLVKAVSHRLHQRGLGDRPIRGNRHEHVNNGGQPTLLRGWRVVCRNELFEDRRLGQDRLSRAAIDDLPTHIALVSSGAGWNQGEQQDGREPHEAAHLSVTMCQSATRVSPLRQSLSRITASDSEDGVARNATY